MGHFSPAQSSAPFPGGTAAQQLIALAAAAWIYIISPQPRPSSSIRKLSVDQIQVL